VCRPVGPNLINLEGRDVPEALVEWYDVLNPNVFLRVRSYEMAVI